MIYKNNNFLDNEFGAVVSYIGVTIPLYIERVVDMHDVFRDKDKFDEFVLKPFGLTGNEFSGDDVIDELAGALVNGYGYNLMDTMSSDSEIAKIINDLGTDTYSLTPVVVDGIGKNNTLSLMCPPYLSKLIGTIMDLYGRLIDNAEMCEFMSCYSSYTIRAILEGSLPFDKSTEYDRYNMIRAITNSLVHEYGVTCDTRLMYSYSQISDVDDLYEFMIDVVFRDHPTSEDDTGAYDNCVVAGMIMLSAIVMSILRGTDKATVCRNFIEKSIEPDDFNVYTTTDDRSVDIRESGICSIDMAASYYLSYICPAIATTNSIGESDLSKMKAYSFDHIAYHTVTAALRVFGMIGSNAKEAFIKSFDNTTTNPMYNSIYKTCVNTVTRGLNTSGISDDHTSVIEMIRYISSVSSGLWAMVPLPYRYIVVSNYMVSILNDEVSADTIYSSTTLTELSRNTTDAMDAITAVMDDAIASDDTKTISGFEHQIKQALVKSCGTLNAAKYIDRLSSGFMLFIDELVMTLLMY